MTNTIKQRLLSLVMALALACSLLPTAAFAATVDSTYTPGTYTGEATGYAGTVSVNVTLANGKISDLTATGEKETSSKWTQALAIVDVIKGQNGTDGLIEKLDSKAIDTVTGATVSAKAIVNATEQALSKAVSGFAGGTGTQADPYQVSSEAGLRYLQSQVAAGESYAGQYIQLTSNIALTGEWTPIGESKDKAFAGTFDGDGHTISGLTITDNSLGHAGLFGYVLNGTVIRDVKLTGVSINIQNAAQNVYAGALVGYVLVDSKGTASTIVDGCMVSGSISVFTQDKQVMVGGLMGFGDQRAAVTNCGADVAVTANSGSKNANVGGLVGMTSINSLFMNDYALGKVEVTTTGTPSVGGLFGWLLSGIVYNCYAAGEVTLTGTGTTGGIAGNLAGAYVDSCYYANTNTAPVGKTTKGSYNDKTVLAKTAEELKNQDFADLLHNNLAPAALNSMATAAKDANVKDCTDFNAFIARVDSKFQDWALTGGKVLLTGALWTTGVIDASIFAGGTGTETDPYRIKTEDQLRAFAGSLNDKIDYTNQYVKLDADIDVSSKDWSPVGESDYLFNGTFDGAGHTVSGLTMGTAEEPYQMDKDHIYLGFFGVLGQHAVVRDLSLTNVSIHSEYKKAGTTVVGGIAAVMQSYASDYTGGLIDGCSVSGTISHVGTKGNQFVGGLVGMQYKGAVINSSTQVTLSGVVKGEELAEVGGLVGFDNRGLVANCWSVSNVYGSGDRTNGGEGMANVSNLVACSGGMVVNCWGTGSVKTYEHSVYAGVITGWVTGIGKTYACWYDLNTEMILKTGDENPQVVSPVEPIGTKVSSGVNEEGDAYIGGLVDGLTGYTSDTYASIADGLNKTFEAFPIDIKTIYKLDAKALKNWTYDSAKKLVIFGDGYGTVTYVQPECEKYVAPERVLQDGTWYGRDDGKTTVVKITVESNKVTDTTVLSGDTTGDDYEAAVEKAKYKSTYGDTTHYEKADPSQFAGGSGTQADPYRIANEAQLRYLSSSINADVSWDGVWFRQTADITLTGGEWQPIGNILFGEVNGAAKQIAAYPFRGNYDGGNHTITGLTIGSKEAPADRTTSGLFGLPAGTYSTNEALNGDEQVVELKNIHLRDVSIYISTRYETYTGGLVGQGQNGVYIDNCSVTGVMDITAKESFGRVGGLAAVLLRGAATNCWTDMTINGVAGTGELYAGGLYGIDNRATTVNCYVLGDVTGTSENTNKVHIGGLSGQNGGVHVNCYAAGDVISSKATTDVGILNGRSAGVSVEYNCYYNTEAVLKQGDTTVSPAVANGVAVSSATQVSVVGKTAQELASQSFADLLTGNRTASSMAATMEEVDEVLTKVDLGHVSYYRGNDLSSWVAKNGIVTFGTASSSNGSSSSSRATLTFDTNGGSAIAKVTKAKGSTVDLTAYQPTRSGYVFAGWCSDQALTKPVTSVKLTSSTTVYAKWTKVQTSENPFTDVKRSDYFYDAVLWAVKKDITTGMSAATFGPEESCTRAQMVTFLWRAAGQPQAKNAQNPFADVKPSDYFYEAVLWAVENGITTGMSATTFGPEESCTRAQMVTFLWRAAGQPQAKNAQNPFTDVKPSDYFYEAVLWAVENGITTGMDATTFGPGEDCTRGQIVTFLYRANT